MLATADIAAAVGATLARHRLPHVVLDTVMVAKGGARLLDDAAVAAIREALFPLAEVVTANGPEATALTDLPVTTVAEARRAAERLVALGARAALVKGGHLEGPAIDVLLDGREVTEFRAERIDTPHTHGTGCTLASAIAARLALGDSLVEATRHAKRYVTDAIRHAPGLGRGHGPLRTLLSSMTPEPVPVETRKRRLPHLYVQVLIAILAGGLFGYLAPAPGRRSSSRSATGSSRS